LVKLFFILGQNLEVHLFVDGGSMLDEFLSTW
jgi:hypothetical protein